MLIVAEIIWILRISHHRIHELVWSVKLGRYGLAPRSAYPVMDLRGWSRRWWVMMPAGLVCALASRTCARAGKDLPNGSSLLPSQLVQSGFDREDQPESHHADREPLQVNAGDNASTAAPLRANRKGCAVGGEPLHACK